MAGAPAKASIVISGTTNELEAAVDRANKKLTSLATTAVGLFAGVAVFNWGYDLLKQAEASEIAFTKMLGSADVAKQTLKEIADFAAKTPMDNPTLVKAYQSLLAFKFAANDIPGILRVLGDAASAMPGNLGENVNKLSVIMGQMRSKAKLSAGEMLQLTEAGVNAWEYLRQALNKRTVAEVIAESEKGAIDSATAVRAVLSGMEKDFKGLMETRSKSVEGLVSTIQDNLGRGLNAVFKGATGGEFKTWLDDVGNGMNSLGDIGMAVGNSIAGAFQVIKNSIDVVRAVGEAFGEVLAAMFPNAGPAMEWFNEGLKNLRTDMGYVKDLTMKFIEVTAVGFAMAGDAINNFLVEPIKIFVGFVAQFVSRVIQLIGTLLEGLGYVSDTAAEMAKTVKQSATSVNEWGKELVDKGMRGMDSGPVAAQAVKGFFDRINAPKPQESASTMLDTASADWIDALEEAAGRLLDFNKQVKDMASIAPIFGNEMAQLAKEAQDERNKKANKLLQDAKSPGQVFQDRISELMQMFADKQINKQALGVGMQEAVKQLASNLPQYSANSGIQAGSVEAQSTYIANRQGGSMKVTDILKSIESQAKEQAQINNKLLEQMQKSKLIPAEIR